MVRGKKSISEQLVYDILSEINYKYKTNPIKLISSLMSKLLVVSEVRSKKYAGTSRPTPTITPSHRRIPLGIRLFRDAIHNRSENTLKQRILVELNNLYEGRGEALKKRNQIHQQVEFNRANIRGKKIRKNYKW